MLHCIHFTHETVTVMVRHRAVSKIRGTRATQAEAVSETVTEGVPAVDIQTHMSVGIAPEAG